MSAVPRDDTKKEIYTASQWRLMWYSFKKHRLANVGGVIILVTYIVVVFAEFFAPYDPRFNDLDSSFAPPMRIHVLRNDGKISVPFVYLITQRRDPDSFMLFYEENKDKVFPISFFVRGDPYKLWGLIAGDVHLFGLKDGRRMYVLGTDQQGRDMLSRIIYGARISMSIGLIGVSISFVLSIIFGCVSGYIGGMADIVIQRMIEVLTSLPSLPLWMSLAVAIPLRWSVTQVFFAITVILSLISWPGLARQVRGKILALKQTDFITAAILDNAKMMRVIGSYLTPAILSHLIASITLAIPRMILAETALSFLGIGLRQPAISWGVLLQDAQNIETLVSYSWLFLPVIPIIVVILSFNFLGDGLRDAADPYKD